MQLTFKIIMIIFSKKKKSNNNNNNNKSLIPQMRLSLEWALSPSDLGLRLALLFYHR